MNMEDDTGRGSPSSSSTAAQRHRFGKKTMGVKARPAPHTSSFSNRGVNPRHDQAIDREESVVFARKSAAAATIAPRERSPPPQARPQQPVLRTKSARTSSSRITSAMGPPSANAIAGPSRHNRPSIYGPDVGIGGPRRHDHPQYREAPGSGDRRVSFPLPSPSSNHRALPARKTMVPQQLSAESPSVRRRSMITASAPEVFPVKSATLVPFWQHDEDERAKSRGSKRHSDQEERDFVKRVAIASSSRRITGIPQTAVAQARPNVMDTLDRRKSFLGRNMRLKMQGEKDDGSDSPMEVDGPRPPPQRKVPALTQMGVKAARKREWPPPLFDSESSDQSEDLPVESSDEEDEEVDELDSDSDQADDDKMTIQKIVEAARRSFSPAEIEILPGPPWTLDPTAQKQAPAPTTSKDLVSSTPSDAMMNAIEALTLSCVRMQRTKQLPFLLRNLRKGFSQRCRRLGIPTKRNAGTVQFGVRYEYSSDIHEGHVFGTQLDNWICPLCELHGAFATREMLKCHLNWDHDTFPTQWSLLDSKVWLLRLLITDVISEEERHDTPVPADTTARVVTPPPDSNSQERDSLSPFPFVTLSPPEPQPVRETPTPRTGAQAPPSSLFNVKLQAPPASPSPVLSRSRERSITATSNATPAPSSSRGRSATAATTTTTTTTTTATTAGAVGQRTSRPDRYPTPPPASNPLGPAAQPPYLPAKSEYGGPDIYYSCRPGGACLYDLLNTLPLEPFGVLAWDILDREDEIYDSDNVKDEYKVMHALWARWIVLNRNTFIADYYKGTVAFVDCYWRMIHRAAGWDALRYWLLMLLANRFINGGDIAKILKHYEGLTGMDTWYE